MLSQTYTNQLFLTEGENMKYLFSLLMITSYASYAMSEDTRINDEHIEELRKMSCEVARRRILSGASLPTTEHNVYGAFEFILKHCSQEKISLSDHKIY